jgi:hypothetical protein
MVNEDFDSTCFFFMIANVAGNHPREVDTIRHIIVMPSYSNIIVATSRSGVASGDDKTTVTAGVAEATFASPRHDRNPSSLPLDTLNQKEMVAILAQELNQLSFIDRTNIQEEIHGVHSMTPIETPKMIEEALLDFSHQISLLPSAKTIAYEQALSLDSQYVHDQDFRLKFIRADMFDIPKAVERFMAYLDLTEEHFGTDVLLRPILQRDLKKMELEVMRKGGLQLLSSRDRAGRLVVVYQGVRHFEGLDMKSIVRHSMATLWITVYQVWIDVLLTFYFISIYCLDSPFQTRIFLYLWTAFSDDETSQRKGFVAIHSLDTADKLMFSSSNNRSLWKLKKAILTRLGAMHISFPSEPVFQVMKAILDLSPSSDRVRTKLYSGGLTMETQYKLMTFGISSLPITCTGQIKNKFHIQWLKIRNAYESARLAHPSTSRLDWIFIPETNDVLFRGGSGNPHHYGNLEFELIVESKLSAYYATTDSEAKRDIRQEVVDVVKSRGGRLLEISKEHKYRWVEITDMEALQNKLYAYFYQHKKRLDTRAKQQNSNSDTARFLNSESKRRKIETTNGCCWRV